MRDGIHAEHILRLNMSSEILLGCLSKELWHSDEEMVLDAEAVPELGRYGAQILRVCRIWPLISVSDLSPVLGTDVENYGILLTRIWYDIVIGEQ